MIAYYMRCSPFLLTTDGLNDESTSATHLYPVVVRCFESEMGQVQTFLLSLPKFSDSTGKSIFDVLDAELSKKKLSWSNC